MKTHEWLRHVIMQIGGSVGSAPREPSTGTVRAWARCGLFVLALVLGGLCAAASGHDSAGHVQASAHQPADNLARSADAGSMSSGLTNRLPWMY
jgi:hypothetical protein